MGINRRARTAKRKLARADWVAQAVTLAADGWSQREIAAKVGKSKTAVQKAIQQELQDRRAPAEKIEEARDVMREQIDRLLRVWIPKAGDGDQQAAAVVARCWERRAKLDGLDAPARVDSTIRLGDLPLLTDDELLRVAQGLPVAATGGGGTGVATPEESESD